MNDILMLMWESHRDYVKSVLVSLTHDIDLADDLTQETYLRARSGISGYRGGDARAWLAAIARNVFYQHSRRKYTQLERPYDTQAELTTGHVRSAYEDELQIDLRETLANLDPVLRTTLVMKYYGGFTYKEISERLGCPIGTAKWRVSTALDKLRTNLGAVRKEQTPMKCEELTGALLLDYIDGMLPKKEQEAVRLHLAECPACAEKGEQIAKVLKALDAIEADYKSTGIIEIDEKGDLTSYLWFSMPNPTEESMETMDLGQNGLQYMTVRGKEVQLEPTSDEPAEDGMRAYKIHLPQPIPPGEKIPMHFVVHHPLEHGAIVKLDNGVWRFGPGKLILTEELVYLMAVRIPSHAQLIKTEPEANEIHTNGKTTVIWRGTLPPDQLFQFWVEYRLE